MLDRIKRKKQRLEKAIESIPFTILVFGSGKEYPKYFKKRQDIIKALKGVKFDAYSCEELSDLSPSGLYLADEEGIYLEEADWAIFLDTSSGPLSELSAYCQDPDVVRKAFVLYPQQYSKTPDQPDTYPKDVLWHYPHKEAYTETQVDKCDLIPKCLEQAKALRYAKFSETVGKPRALQF